MKTHKERKTNASSQIGAVAGGEARIIDNRSGSTYKKMLSRRMAATHPASSLPVQFGCWNRKRKAKPELKEVHSLGENWLYLPLEENAILVTTEMTYCWALIVVNPNGSRLLWHLSGGNATASGDGIKAINGHIDEKANCKLVMGRNNERSGSTTIKAIYDGLGEVKTSPGPTETIPGYYTYAFILPDGKIGVSNVKPSLERFKKGKMTEELIENK